MTRCLNGQKHDWRKIGAVYDKEHGLRPTKRRCQVCGEIENLLDDRTDDEQAEDRDFARGPRR